MNSYPPSNNRILIIEDDIVNCFVYEIMFEEYGYQIDFAYDGQSGIEAYVQNEYDLVLLDMGLPFIMGYDVARLMRNHDNDGNKNYVTTIIALSADCSFETKKKAFDAGVDKYLTKPFDMTKLLNVVKNYLN